MPNFDKDWHNIDITYHPKDFITSNLQTNKLLSTKKKKKKKKKKSPSQAEVAQEQGQHLAFQLFLNLLDPFDQIFHHELP